MEEEKNVGEQHGGLPENAESEPVGTEAETEIPSLTENGNEGQKYSDLVTTTTDPVLVEHEIGHRSEQLELKNEDEDPASTNQLNVAPDHDESLDTKNGKENEPGNSSQVENCSELVKEEEIVSEGNLVVEASLKPEKSVSHSPVLKDVSNKSIFDPPASEGDDSGTEEEQAAFMKELENFFRERSLEFKPPKFYGEGLNCLK